MKTTRGKGRNLFLSEVILRPIYTFFHLLTLLILFKKIIVGSKFSVSDTKSHWKVGLIYNILALMSLTGSH